MISDPLPEGRLSDTRRRHRSAVARLNHARRQGLFSAVCQWSRVVAKARRALRFAARVRAGRVRIWLIDTRAARTDPSCSHPLFSATPEKQAAPTLVAHPDRRWTFQEGRRRR